MKDLRVDKNRAGLVPETGIYVRAIGLDSRWGTYDMAELDKESLAEFVRSRGDVPDFAVGIIEILLDHSRT